MSTATMSPEEAREVLIRKAERSEAAKQNKDAKIAEAVDTAARISVDAPRRMRRLFTSASTPLRTVGSNLVGLLPYAISGMVIGGALYGLVALAIYGVNAAFAYNLWLGRGAAFALGALAINIVLKGLGIVGRDLSDPNLLAA